MKKFATILFSLIMICSLSDAVFADEQKNTDEIVQRISDVYGIALSDIELMPEEIFLRLADDIDEIDTFSANDTYWQISYDENGENVAKEATYQEYMFSTFLRDTDESSWMRIHTTIVDKGSKAQISATYTWLTKAAPRMKDVIGLSVVQGTILDNTADGFYTYSTSDGSVYTDFSKTPSAFDYQGDGLIRCVTLGKPDKTVKGEMLFMKADIVKEGNSEGLNGSYAHQKLSISSVPSFTIDKNGIIASNGVNMSLNYTQFRGYTSVQW